jgi:LPXTG-site transpeptidase (sortase) family protein
VSPRSLRYLISITLSIILVSFLTVPTSAANQPTITISSLNISHKIKEFRLSGETWAIDPWERGIGHLEQTGWFDNPTNIVLAGHSTMPNGKPGVFAALDNLSLGQEIVLFDGNADRHYQVSDIRIVPVDDISVVMPTDHERLTLITCEISSYNTSIQGYTQRLVVIADRVS